MIRKTHFPFRILLAIAFFSITIEQSLCQTIEIPSATLLSKSIAYHDPDHQWDTFASTFYVVQETPNKPPRTQKIYIDIPNEQFEIRYQLDNHDLYYQIDKGQCMVTFDGKTQFSEKDEKDYSLTCDRATMWRNYYTYLYGLPMKLYDPGTNLAPDAEKVAFMEQDYWRLKVTYDEQVGSDVWFFYFNLETFALEAYQFYKGDPEGAGKNTGEYILLSELGTVHGILMPKIRRWFYNKNDEFLGTDFLYNSSPGN